MWVPTAPEDRASGLSYQLLQMQAGDSNTVKQSNIKNWSQTLHYKCVQTFPNNVYMAQREDFGRLVCVSYVAMLRNPHLHLDIHSAKGRQQMYSCLISFGSLKKTKNKTNKYYQN